MGATGGGWSRHRRGGRGDGLVAGAALTAGAVPATGTAKIICDAARLSALGAVLLPFSSAAAAHDATRSAYVLPYTALAAAGEAPAWLLGVSGRLVRPDRPQRLAVATAFRNTPRHCRHLSCSPES
ncbi:hypothetical protein ACWD5Q_21140 [Streptomyces sp. NPDC002513]